MRTITFSLFALLGLAAGAGCAQTQASTSGGSTSSTSASSTGSGAGGAGAGGDGAGGTGGQFTPGQPITATDQEWTWVPFDNAFCANGKSTGIGVNLSSASSRVLIYLEGGGACWNEVTCYTLMTATNFAGGYGEADFESESKDTGYLAEPGGFFDRTAAANPFKDYSYVYVPYCTGDIHAGNAVTTYGDGPAHFVGFKNMTAYLERLVTTFPKADRVILSGSSAGGFGAAYNWWQTQQAFGATRVDLLDDSGTPMPADIEADGFGEEILRASWNLAATLPPGCTQCKTSLAGLLAFYEQQYPKHSAALLSFVEDSTLPSFFGVTEAQFEMGLAEDISTYFTPTTNFKYFTYSNATTYPNGGHVLWFTPQLTQGGVTLQQFVTQMVTDDPAWTSVHP
jgi:Pectinacetylesterase